MIDPALIRKQRITVAASIILILGTIAVSLGLGSASVSFDRILPALFGQGTFKEEFVLFDLRLPRILITLLAGMALALSGAILQGITRNDLVDPGFMGINSGAGLAVTVFFLFVPIEPGSFIYILPLTAFIGGLLTALAIYFFAYSKKNGMQPVSLVLVGVGFSMALSGAMIVLISSADQVKVDFIAKWLAGNVWGTDWPFIWALLPWLVVLIPFALYKANTLNLLSLSEPVSIGAGVALQKERLILLLTAVGLAASAVSVTGGISFIGLMAPHIAKAITGPRNQLFIPVALLLGGWLLLFADTIGRNILDPSGVPAGIMVSLIGAPYFVYLLMRK
ncbi:iron chelate uptake ABC transporter family permease subunit [Bacillus mangrovi]|uniref:Iron chelate uptake ABC transporter family permease subunit n=1 Tax=Metabacillus mangrovi TaxID=1491830 RepID=A0A7X2V606_9BACI|nr:iron ABC transporter permease [Metabacillus mangrovi]MTH54736.1 iron chelate uptake ABC transporter family permease subunit [Metabacillus mangrovi]